MFSLVRCVMAVVFVCGLSAPAFAGQDVIPPETMTAFHVPWDAASLQSYIDHQDQIDILSPQWVLVDNPTGAMTLVPDAKMADQLAKRKPGLKIMPLVANAHDGMWDSAAAAGVITSPDARVRMAEHLAKLAAEMHFDGYVLDLENLDRKSIAALPDFIRALNATLHPSGLDLWFAVPVGDEQWPFAEMQKAGSGLLFMAYDQCWDTSTPGPVAGVDWLSTMLPKKLRNLDSERVIIALAGYGYDWPSGKAGHSITVAEARRLARDHKARQFRGRDSGNVMFRYKTGGVAHTVWYVDGHSYSHARTVVSRLGLRHIAMWRLGSEDPAMWAPENVSSTRLPLTASPTTCEPLPGM